MNSIRTRRTSAQILVSIAPRLRISRWSWGLKPARNSLLRGADSRLKKVNSDQDVKYVIISSSNPVPRSNANLLRHPIIRIAINLVIYSHHTKNISLALSPKAEKIRRCKNVSQKTRSVALLFDLKFHLKAIACVIWKHLNKLSLIRN